MYDEQKKQVAEQFIAFAERLASTKSNNEDASKFAGRALAMVLLATSGDKRALNMICECLVRAAAADHELESLLLDWVQTLRAMEKVVDAVLVQRKQAGLEGLPFA